MDFSQEKLGKQEWESIEVRLPSDELEILQMVYNQYDDVNKSYNKNSSFISCLKVGTTNIDQVHWYLYDNYFLPRQQKLCKKYKIDVNLTIPKKSKVSLKKIDKMRIENMDSKLNDQRSSIYEFLLLSLIEQLCDSYKHKKETQYKLYYTLYHLQRKNIIHKNVFMDSFVIQVLDHYHKKGVDSIQHLVYNSYDIIEKNSITSRYRDMELYEHQKQLFTYTKDPSPKIILYQAPTGTGKTISPIGLAKKHRVIFVCAAKHVGLQLAKACVNCEIPLAIAFGCKDAGDVRLHYNAAKDIVKNYKTGGIFRVDNTVGDRVQVIVSDVESYIPAMNYMCAFREPNDIITYWDEPTISLDYDTHKFHSTLSKNWKENIIPHMILSSATLPPMSQLTKVIQSFKQKHKDCVTYNIVSHDCKKTIPILDTENNVCLPHTLLTEKKALQNSVLHCKQYKTLLRHFDIQEIVSFIRYVHHNIIISKDRYKLVNYFESYDDVSLVSIKEYYLDLLKHISKKWVDHSESYMNTRSSRYTSTMKFTTKDSHTLTHGPTIYIADDVTLIGKYCLKLANIPVTEMDTILDNINSNSKISQQIDEINKMMKEFVDKNSGNDTSGEKELSKSAKGIVREMTQKMNELKRKIKPVRLPSRYVPNSKDHQMKYTGKMSDHPFTCDIHDSVIEEIMLTNVPVMWKMLLMIGVGIFTELNDTTYLEIMKRLANTQKLYMILATSDYIYGTNYQFCHEYIGKDVIKHMTQEKAIQAFGRVGRQSFNQDYSIRIRDNSLLTKVFMEEQEKKEVIKMNELFGE